MLHLFSTLLSALPCLVLPDDALVPAKILIGIFFCAAPSRPRQHHLPTAGCNPCLAALLSPVQPSSVSKFYLLAMANAFAELAAHGLCFALNWNKHMQRTHTHTHTHIHTWSHSHTLGTRGTNRISHRTPVEWIFELFMSVASGERGKRVDNFLLLFFCFFFFFAILCWLTTCGGVAVACYLLILSKWKAIMRVTKWE